MSLRLGQTYVPGQDRATIGALLAAAEDLGLPARVVKTTEGGLVVPTEVHEKAFPPPKAHTRRRNQEDDQ